MYKVQLLPAGQVDHRNRDYDYDRDGQISCDKWTQRDACSDHNA
jgi:hypothetical protein